MKTVKITTGNEISVINVNFDDFKSIQKEIGCDLFEIVKTRKMRDYFGGPVVMLVDEEGLCKGLPINAAGCYFYDTARHGAPIVGDIILGVQYGPDIAPPADAIRLKEKLLKDLPFLRRYKA